MLEWCGCVSTALCCVLRAHGFDLWADDDVLNGSSKQGAEPYDEREFGSYIELGPQSKIYRVRPILITFSELSTYDVYNQEQVS